MRSPQRGTWIVWQTASHVAVFGGSHCSTPRSRYPSPQNAFLQPRTHASSLRLLPSSHSSPVCTVPSPQMGVHTAIVPVQLHPASTTHASEHPSPLAVFPSSHCPACRSLKSLTPLPQMVVSAT